MMPSISTSLNHSWIVSIITGDHLLRGSSRRETGAASEILI